MVSWDFQVDILTMNAVKIFFSIYFVIPEPSFPSQGSQARGTRLTKNKFDQISILMTPSPPPPRTPRPWLNHKATFTNRVEQRRLDSRPQSIMGIERLITEKCI